jgi:hypothetical protein
MRREEMNSARPFLGLAISLAGLMPQSGAARADAANLEQQVRQRAQAVEGKLIAWRRDIHQHPELGDQETRTAKLVAEHLRGLELEVREGVARTGVIGLLKGGKPGRTVALRADMDALRRVLTDGGRVVLSVWQSLHLHPVYEALFDATTRRMGAALSDVALSFSLGDADELRALLSDAGFQSVEVRPRSLEVHLPSPERFVELTVLGAATSVPTFAKLDAAARRALIKSASAEVEAVLSRFLDDDTLTFPMSSHIAVANATRLLMQELGNAFGRASRRAFKAPCRKR